MEEATSKFQGLLHFSTSYIISTIYSEFEKYIKRTDVKDKQVNHILKFFDHKNCKLQNKA